MSITADRIKERRKALHINQLELSERTGISQGQISRYERGDNDPTGEALVALADVLNTTTDWLLGRSGNVSPVGQETGLTEEENELIKLLRVTDRQMRHRIMKAVKAVLECGNKKAPLQALYYGAGGTRTHTLSRAEHFKCPAAADYATAPY
jgi:transcriptional regulator with XRE-family HTH domain